MIFDRLPPIDRGWKLTYFSIRLFVSGGHLSFHPPAHPHKHCCCHKAWLLIWGPSFLWDGGYRQIYLNSFAGLALMVFNSIHARTHAHTIPTTISSHLFSRLRTLVSPCIAHLYSHAGWGYYKAWLGGNQFKHLKSQNESNVHAHIYKHTHPETHNV